MNAVVTAVAGWAEGRGAVRKRAAWMLGEFTHGENEPQYIAPFSVPRRRAGREEEGNERDWYARVISEEAGCAGLGYVRRVQARHAKEVPTAQRSAIHSSLFRILKLNFPLPARHMHHHQLCRRGCEELTLAVIQSPRKTLFEWALGPAHRSNRVTKGVDFLRHEGNDARIGSSSAWPAPLPGTGKLSSKPISTLFSPCT